MSRSPFATWLKIILDFKQSTNQFHKEAKMRSRKSGVYLDNWEAFLIEKDAQKIVNFESTKIKMELI